MKKLTLLFLGISLLGAWAPSDDFLAKLSSKLESYNQLRPAEHLYLAFNQDKFAESDTVYFSAYHLDSDLLPKKGKKIVVLGLVNAKGELINKINFSIQDGLASNQLAIPQQVKPGIYTLVAFRPNANSENSILFSKEIAIVTKTKILAKENKLKKVEFYFEGGHFISEVANHIIIRSDYKGAGIIKNEKNEEVAKFIVNQNGIGSVTFTPKIGSTYLAEIEDNSNKYPIKNAEAEGFTLLISTPSESKSKKILVSVPVQSSLVKQESYLVVMNKRKIIYSSPVAVDSNGSFSVTIPDENIANGLTQVLVFDKNANILAERKIFTNYPKVTATLELSKKEYGQREKVPAELTLRDRYGNPIQGTFSISVAQNDPSFKQSFSMAEDILLSEFFQTTKNEWPALAGDRLSTINDFLITKNSNIVPWGEVISDNPINPRAEAHNLSLKGRAVYRNSLKPVPDSTHIIGYLQNTMIGYEARTTKNGNFQMQFLFDFWGKDEVFYLMESNEKELSEPYLIIPDSSSFSIKFNGRSMTYITTDSLDGYGEYSFKKKIVNESFNFFSASQNQSVASLNLNDKFEEEAMGTDLMVNVQDYVVFPTMADLIHEVIPFLEYRKKGDKNSIRLLINKKTNYVRPKSEPLFVIDGALTKNKDFFLSLKPIDVISIKIINDANKLSHMGVLGKNGIVLVETKRSLTSKVEENSTLLKTEGLSKFIPFRSKDYSSISVSSSRLPDFRSTLYWSPTNAVTIYGKSTINFYSSDDLGKMKISVKGVTKQGEPFEAEAFFDVTFNK